MTDPLSRLRADVDAEISESSRRPEVGEERLPEDLEEVFRAHYAGEPPSEAFLAALEALSELAAIIDAPPGLAASSSRRLQTARTLTVEQALGVSLSRARTALTRSLRITSDAADLLLDRPAAALWTYRPDAVAGAADACGRLRGEVFKAIADSLRMSGDYVYAYRPGADYAEPAERAAEERGSVAGLVEWGRAFLDAPPARG